MLPTNQAKDLKGDLEKNVGVVKYAQVYMKLSELIDGDFFNHYIKSGTCSTFLMGLTGLNRNRQHLNAVSGNDWPR